MILLIFKMSDREESDLNKPKVNGLSNHGKEEGFEIDLDVTLAALLASSLISPDEENLSDLSQIAGEYSSLNNTIDELNRYLDRWDERHEQLRAHIREAKRANDEEERQCLEEDEDKETGSTLTASDNSKNNGNESVSKEKQDGDDKSI